MYGHGSQFSRKKEKAVDALITCRTYEDAARQAGISSRTLHRWLKDPEFNEAYLMARVNSHKQRSARVQQVSPVAVNTLIEVMKNPKSPASARVRAAGLLLGESGKGMERE